MSRYWDLANSKHSANVSSGEPYVYMANCKYKAWAGAGSGEEG